MAEHIAGFNIVSEVNPKWTEYDRVVANTHLYNFGVIFVDPVYGQPIDNEYDLAEIEKELCGRIVRAVENAELEDTYFNAAASEKEWYFSCDESLLSLLRQKYPDAASAEIRLAAHVERESDIPAAGDFAVSISPTRSMDGMDEDFDWNDYGRDEPVAPESIVKILLKKIIG